MYEVYANICIYISSASAAGRKHSLKKVMYQENADSWYITMFLDRFRAVLSSVVPKISRNLVQHLSVIDLVGILSGTSPLK